MPVPGPGGEKARQIQNVGTYIENNIQGQQGTQAASDYEAYAAAHSRYTAGQAFIAWLFKKLGPALGATLGLSMAATGKAANQIASGTVSGLDKTGQNRLDQALGHLEQAVTSPVDALTGINAIGDFFNRLTQSATWVRVGEVVAGGLLLYLGLKAVVAPSGANVGRQTVKSTASNIASGVKKAAELASAG